MAEPAHAKHLILELATDAIGGALTFDVDSFEYLPAGPVGEPANGVDPYASVWPI